MCYRWLLAGAVVTATLGCGQSGIPRFQVSGKVRHDGQPVPSGQIVFEPDREQGNSGPPAIAQIIDGSYVTPKNKGVIGGAQSVTVYGYDGSPPSEPLPYGRPIFEAYQTTLQVPDEDTVHDFDIPNRRS